jgi:hypothetical protein
MLRKLLSAILLLLGSAAALAPGQTPVYKLLWSPGSLGAPGGQPVTILEAAPGLFYVLGTLDQSTFGASVFSITNAGTFKLLYSQPPYFTSIAIVQATNGHLYNPGFDGNTQQNFYFSTNAAGSDLVEYPFPDNLGSGWQTSVAPGKMYDIVGSSTQEGVTTYDFAQISETGQITVLHQFSGSDGTPTGANLALGPDGNFYGIGNQQPGGISPGFIFRFTPKGEYSQLLAFPEFPEKGFHSIIFASDGNLYGLFGNGGPSNSGTLYQATLSGQLHVLAYFPSTMATPQTLVQASDGSIYGSTNSSAIFRYDMTTHALTNAYQFVQGGTEGLCYCQLIQGMDGKIYGVTGNGGPYPGNGAVFSLDFGLPPPQPVVTALYPATAAVGKEVMLWGKYLLGASSVTFNGVPAITIHRTSAQSVTATVPAGATTGPVTITTQNGSFTTTQVFTVE